MQVKLRANEAISTYYDGWLRCDEACGCQSRCVCTRTTGDAAPGTLSAHFPQVRCASCTVCVLCVYCV